MPDISALKLDVVPEPTAPEPPAPGPGGYASPPPYSAE